MRIRTFFFWLHLIAGVVAGLVILVMSATGVVLAFEKEIIAWTERDVRRLTLHTPEAKRLSLDEMLVQVRVAQPEARPTSLTIHSDQGLAVLVSLGRTNSVYVNPYTGALQPQGAKRTRAFMRTMIEWHRYLAQSEKKRPVGKAITGACNLAFLFLAVSGLYLWWPRQWTKNAWRAGALFNMKLRGKARDWNWHNVIGLWSAPVLIVLTTTALPISYRWAGDLIYKITRTTAPGPASPAPATPPAPAGAKPLTYEAIFASVQQQAPRWHQITIRMGGSEARPAATVGVAVKQRDGSPRFATTQFTLNAFTGETLRLEQYRDGNLGRRVRSWTRFLHTGEALGPVGQFAAGLASLGGVVLVYTGFALALRRWLRRREKKSSVSRESVSESVT